MSDSSSSIIFDGSPTSSSSSASVQTTTASGGGGGGNRTSGGNNQGNNNNNNSRQNFANSASLYLCIFLATCALLLGVSAAIAPSHLAPRQRQGEVDQANVYRAQVLTGSTPDKWSGKEKENDPETPSCRSWA